MHDFQTSTGLLHLTNDTVYKGYSFGSSRNVAGEVVFNTAMTGYVETLTDPSYKGQIVVLTYPLVGNYGVPKPPFESAAIQVQGLVIPNLSDNPNHHLSLHNLHQWLLGSHVPGLYGVDTRSLTQLLREHGTIEGSIHTTAANAELSDSIPMHDVLSLVAGERVMRCGTGNTRILVVDTGAKYNIMRSLVRRGAQVVCAPWNLDWESYLPEVDGILLTNGPGDPRDATALVQRVRHTMSLGIPMFGICFGHQLLALAAGASSTKMRYGNRSVNQPVQDLMTKRCYMTSQNHGYVVDSTQLPEDFTSWFINLNDRSNEGIRHKTLPISSVQFHPEAAPGPNDTAFLFDDFLAVASRLKRSHLRSNRIDALQEMVLT